MSDASITILLYFAGDMHYIETEAERNLLSMVYGHIALREKAAITE